MAADLCTVADVKALAGKDGDSTNDDVWAKLIVNASDLVRQLTGRTYAATAMNRLLDGTGKSELFLPGGPWTEVTSVTMCGVPIFAQPADNAAGYFLDDSGNLLCLFGYCFPRSKKSVRVMGAAGSDSIPARVVQATQEIVIWMKQRGPLASQVQVTDGPNNQQTQRWSIADLPPTAKTIIELERNKVPA